MKTKHVLALVLVAMMAFSLAACAAPAPAAEAPAEKAPAAEAPAMADGKAEAPAMDAAEPVTLTLMGSANNLAKSYMTSIFEQYQAVTGNKLDIIAIDDANYDTIATSKFATGDIPDVFMHFNNSNLNNYNVPANFYYLNDQSWVSDMTSGSYNYCLDADGNVLGLPFWESSVSGCYYNKTLFDELGLKPATTQAEFDALCQALADAGHTPICWPAGCHWMYQFGLDPLFADNPEMLKKINSNEITYAEIPEVTAMTQWIGDAAAKGWFGKTFLTDGWGDISTIVGTGEAAMVLIWDTWFYTNFDEGFNYTKDDFALMPVFTNTTENGTYEGGNLCMLMVNKNGKNVDAALELLNFCATPDNYNKAFDGISTVSVFKGQTANIQSQMVTDAADSLAKYLRTSTAEPKVIGFSQNDAASAFQELFLGNVDAAGCVKLLDDYRMAAAKALGTPGF